MFEVQMELLKEMVENLEIIKDEFLSQYDGKRSDELTIDDCRNIIEFNKWYESEMATIETRTKMCVITARGMMQQQEAVQALNEITEEILGDEEVQKQIVEAVCAEPKPMTEKDVEVMYQAMAEFATLFEEMENYQREMEARQ